MNKEPREKEINNVLNFIERILENLGTSMVKNEEKHKTTYVLEIATGVM